MEGSTLRIRDHVLVSHLTDEAVLLDMETKSYYRLNATGAAIWKALERERPLQEIAAELVAEFEVDETTAQEAVRVQLDELLSLGLVEEEEAPPVHGASEAESGP